MFVHGNRSCTSLVAQEWDMFPAEASIIDKGTVQKDNNPASVNADTTKSGSSAPSLGKRKLALISSLSKSASLRRVAPQIT